MRKSNQVNNYAGQSTYKKRISNAFNYLHQVKPVDSGHKINSQAQQILTSSSKKILDINSKPIQTEQNIREKNRSNSKKAQLSPDSKIRSYRKSDVYKYNESNNMSDMIPESKYKFRKNPSNSIVVTSPTPVAKQVLYQKINISGSKDKDKEKDIPGLKEFDQDIINTYNMNKKDEILNSNLGNEMLEKSMEYSYNEMNDEDGMNPFQKKEKLIKNLLKTKNYQNFIKKIFKSLPIVAKINGKKIEFTSFKKELYDYEFLDIYYKHNIPFIIMRPRLDLIKRKIEERIKKMKEESENEESKLGSKKRLSMDYDSQLTSLLDKSNMSDSIKGKGDRRATIIQSKGNFILTKIPQQTEENTQNKLLNIAFNKAKNAARVIRRLEYSYSMRVNILLNKPFFQNNAKVIQGWWKNVVFMKKNANEIYKLQAYMRGTMIRKAFKEVKETYFHILPFIRTIDQIISRRKVRFCFHRMIQRCGMLKLINITKPFCARISRALESFSNKRKFMRENHMFFVPKKNKCCYSKEIFDWEIRLKLYKAQSAVKFFLMHHSEKIIKEKFANKYNPKLFYVLKYGQNKEKMKSKLKNFRHALIKFKELKLKATLPGNVSNKFQFFKYILKKKIFNKFLGYYSESVTNKKPDYQQKIKLKILLNHRRIKTNKDLLKKYLTRWNIKANYLDEYYNILKLDKLTTLDAIFKYKKKYREKNFMSALKKIRNCQLEQQAKASDMIYKLYDRRNGYETENNLLSRILKVWNKKAYHDKLVEAANIINHHGRIFLEKLYKNRLNALYKCYIIRNKVFQEKLRLWKFNSNKIVHHYYSFVNKTLAIIKTRQKLACLKKNFNSLLLRLKEKMRKYFNRFKTNTGVRKLVLINVQLSFFDENRDIISRDKYSIIDYVRNTQIIDVNKIKKEIIMKKNFNYWKLQKKIEGLKKLCGKRISNLCYRAFYLKKLKFLHWYKIVQQQKLYDASKMIQKNYLIYKNRKNKKEDEIIKSKKELKYDSEEEDIKEKNDNNNNDENDDNDNNNDYYYKKNSKNSLEDSGKTKRWRRYKREIKEDNEDE